MVIKTEIDWLVEKKSTEEEKEIIDAKKEVLGSDYIPELSIHFLKKGGNY